MAQIPLNYFLRVAAELLTTEAEIYTTPTQRATIVLSANAANLLSQPVTVTLKIRSPASVDATIINEFTVLPNDSANLIQGKLILGVGDKIVANCSINNGIELNLSLLESFNTPTA